VPKLLKIDGKDLYYRDLNAKIKEAVREGHKEITVNNVNGQRYLGTGISADVALTLEGTPGNDLAFALDGPKITVKGNAQDGVGNTMNKGEVIIEGSAGDVAGYAMRGGEIFIRGDVGYRVGIHMKAYQEMVPAIVVGGCAGDFLGEYMAGGVIIILGLNCGRGQDLVGSNCAGGMHGGVIYLRGEVEPYKLGREVEIKEIEESDYELIQSYISRFAAYFDLDQAAIRQSEFTKIVSKSKRPYGNLYVSNL